MNKFMNKKIIIIIFFFVFFRSIPNYAEESYLVSKNVLWDGTMYEFYLTEKDLQHAPTWTKDELCPPLKPREALEKAEQFLSDAIGQKTWTKGRKVTWELVSIRLHPFLPPSDYWIYQIEFYAIPPEYIGPVQIFTIVVLQNGTIPQPKISRKEGNASQE